MQYDTIVIGGGIAGSAAALRAAQNFQAVIWIRGDKRTAKRSRGLWVANIDNMIGIHDGIVRKQVLKELRGEQFAEAREQILSKGSQPISTRDIIDNTLERIRNDFRDQVLIVDTPATAARAVDGGFEVQAGEDSYQAPYVILATGVMDRQPFVKKVKKTELVDSPNWVYPFANRESFLYCLRCEGHLTAGSRTTVIGHGESAAQLAMMLHERYESVCCISTNGEAPQWGEQSQQLLDAYGIHVNSSRIVDLEGKPGGMNALVLEDGTRVEVQFALVSLGLYRVYNELAVQLGADLADDGAQQDERHVRINAKGETSVRNLFAVGDMAKRPDEPVMKQVYTSQEYAVRAVDTVDSRIRRKRRQAVLDQVAASR